MTLNLLLLAAEGGGHSGSGIFSPEYGLVFWTAVIFLCVAVLLYKAAWGPLLDALDRREDAITGAIRDAEAIKADAEAVRAQYEEKLEGIRQEAQAIIDEGNEDKKRIVAEAHAKATQEADEIRARVQRDISLAKTKALAEVKQDAVTLGMAIAQKVLAAEIDAKKHQKIVDDVLLAYERG